MHLVIVLKHGSISYTKRGIVNDTAVIIVIDTGSTCTLVNREFISNVCFSGIGEVTLGNRITDTIQKQW